MSINSGVPTYYKRRLYRSRLEARWAAMFDKLGWEAEYEPFDLPGWIPDFAIRTAGIFPLLAEVKPITELTADLVAELDQAAPPEYEVLVLGMSPMNLRRTDNGWDVGEIGWIGSYYDKQHILQQIFDRQGKPRAAGLNDDVPRRPRRWHKAEIGIWRGSKFNLDPEWPICFGLRSVGGLNNWDRISWRIDSNRKSGGLWWAIETITDHWTQAGNATQWKPPRTREVAEWPYPNGTLSSYAKKMLDRAADELKKAPSPADEVKKLKNWSWNLGSMVENCGLPRDLALKSLLLAAETLSPSAVGLAEGAGLTERGLESLVRVYFEAGALNPRARS